MDLRLGRVAKLSVKYEKAVFRTVGKTVRPTCFRRPHKLRSEEDSEVKEPVRFTRFKPRKVGLAVGPYHPSQ